MAYHHKPNIHYVYTGELTKDWKELDIEDMARAADQYDLPGWMKLFCSALKEEEVSGEKVAEMLKAGRRYKHSAARELMMVAGDKIKERREITEDLGLRERLEEVFADFLNIF